MGKERIDLQTRWTVLVESNEASHHLEDARKLWEVSEELTGVQYL